MKRSSDRILTTHVGSLPRPADLLDVVQAKEQGKPVDEKRARRAAAQRGRRDRAQADRARHRRHRRRRVRQAELRLLRQRAPRRLRGRQGSAAAKSVGGLARSQILSRILRRRACGRAPEPHGLHRAHHLSRHGAIADRHRQSQGRARRRASRRRCSCRPSRRPARRTGSATATTRPRRSICSPSPTRLREEYEAIVKAGFLLQVDDPHLVTYWIKEPDLTLAAMPQMGRGAGRGAQPCAAQHCAGKNPAPHLLRHQYGSAHPRHGAQGHRGHHPEDPRRRLFLRGRESAPRARMEAVGDESSCRRARR